MELKDILAISGKPGLFKLLNTKSNGLIVEDMVSAKRTFVSMRKHQFTPLESVGIYTYGDVTDIATVFQKMKDAIAEGVHPPEELSAAELHGYFRKILPDFDEDRVHLSDIKKLIRWYGFLESKELLSKSTDEEE